MQFLQGKNRVELMGRRIVGKPDADAWARHDARLRRWCRGCELLIGSQIVLRKLVSGEPRLLD
jgi:hypothetical protein